MILGMKPTNNEVRQFLSIKVNNIKLEWVSEYKYLGVILDESLTFLKHIDYITNIIKRKLYLFGKIRSYMSSDIAVILYKASILSYFDIGDLFYNSANKNSLTKLQTLQNKALRCIYHSDHRLSVRELHVRAKLLFLQDRRDSNLAAFAHCYKLPCFKLCENRDRLLRSNDTKVLIKPLAKCTKFEKSFVYKAIELWNNAEKELRLISDFAYKTFKLRFKQEMLNNYINFPT